MFELHCTRSIFKPILCAGIDLRFTLIMAHDNKKKLFFSSPIIVHLIA